MISVTLINLNQSLYPLNFTQTTIGNDLTVQIKQDRKTGTKLDEQIIDKNPSVPPRGHKMKTSVTR